MQIVLDFVGNDFQKNSTDLRCLEYINGSVKFEEVSLDPSFG